MSQKNKDGYTFVVFEPSKHDTYLVQTSEGCYDFAHFNGEWGKGNMTGGQPFVWREIPQTED